MMADTRVMSSPILPLEIKALTFRKSSAKFRFRIAANLLSSHKNSPSRFSKGDVIIPSPCPQGTAAR